MFMGAYLIEDESVCDGLVAIFEKDPGVLAPGVVGRDGRAIIDPTSKESLEYSFQPDDARIVRDGRLITVLVTDDQPCLER